MTPPNSIEITRFLEAHAAGNEEALDQLIGQVYGQLRLLAHRQLSSRPPATLDTGGLVHEAYLRISHQQAAWRDRGHFFAAASQAMRHVLVDAARRRCRDKRGGDAVRVDLDPDATAGNDAAESLLDLERALELLEAFNPRLARVVECRAFAGLTEPETAVALGVSVPTVQRDLRAARVWLSAKLGRDRGGSA